MSLSEVVVEGTLKPDGTLELHQKPDLAPGRVRVAMQPLDRPPQPLQENLLQYVLRAREELETRGAPFMNEQEVNAWVEELRADDDRIEQAYRQTVEGEGK